ncbi:MAG: hypothetical protein ISS43_01455 [Candidatus Omnitrophica bacterium]|nr:hypothetical protein [Candidatus Omnitrophota bacterium]
MGIFVPLYYWLAKEKKGQVAPLMILLIAGVLVCMMVVFNIGKASLSKVHTQNAADAAALAATSWLASGSNMVADIGQMMNFASLGFIAMMLCITWPSPGVAYAVVAAFCLQQLQTMWQADTVDDLVHDRAGESALIHAFINVGIDEKKEEPTADEDYETWTKKDTPFSEFMKGQYKRGWYEWDRWAKFERWDEQEKDFTTFKKHRLCRVDVRRGSIPHINYRIGIWPGLTWAEVPFPPWVIPCPFVVVPAYIQVNGNRGTGVTVTRAEGGRDWGFWQMEVPTMVSSAASSTTGSGSIWTGGRFDNEITGVQ